MWHSHNYVMKYGSDIGRLYVTGQEWGKNMLVSERLYEATERNPTVEGDDDAPGSPLSACNSVSLPLSLAYANQSKALVAGECCHVVTTTNIRVERLARQREGVWGSQRKGKR
jgi:hypothetical protein